MSDDKWKRNITTATTMTRYKRRMRAKSYEGATGNQERARRMKQRLNQLKNIVRPYLVDPATITDGDRLTLVDAGYFGPHRALAAGTPQTVFDAVTEIETICRQFDKPLSYLPEMGLIDEAIEMNPEAWETFKNELKNNV